MIEVEVGDTIVEFPDGTAPDVMRNALRKQFGGPVPAQGPEQESTLGRAHREGSEAFQGALSQMTGLGSGKAEDYLGPSGMLRSAKETGSALLGGLGALTAYPMAAASSLGASAAGPALRGAESGIAAGVGQVAPEYAERLRANIPSEEQAYEATKPGVEAALSAVGGRPLTRSVIPPVVPPSAAAIPGTRQAVMEAAARRDIDLPRFYASDNPVTQMTGMGLSNFPVLGTPAIKSTEKLLTDLGKGVGEVATAQGGASMEGAGSRASQNILEWTGEKTRAGLKEAYDDVSKVIDPNIRHASPETKALLDEMVARRENAGLGIPDNLKKIQRALEGPKVEGDDTYALLVQQIGEEAANKVAARMGIEKTAPPSGLNYEGAKDLRTHVRNMQGGQRERLSPGDLNDTELKRLEGALGTDLRSIVEKSGNKTASAAFERANTLAAKVAEDRSALYDIVGVKGDRSPAQVIDRLKAAAGSNSRADAELLLRAKNAVGKDWDEVVSGITAQLGKDNKGNFSALNFQKQFHDLSDVGKTAMYGPKGSAHRQALEDINELSARFNKVQKFQNVSGTARASAVIGAFATPIVALGKMFDPSIMAGAALTRFTASRLAKPLDLSDVLSKPTTAAAGAAWARAYERAQVSGSAAGISNLTLKARDLANNINSEFGTKVEPEDLMPK